MNRHVKTGVVLALALAGAGCDDFLSGPGLNENPNNAVDATPTAQFVAVQANMFNRLEGQLARFAGIYTQQLIGSNNQQQVQGTNYGVTEADVTDFFTPFYTGGGLVGMRKVRAAAVAAGDKRWEGIMKVWEAYAFGTAASLWGDIPYSEANNPDIVTPKLDRQADVYAAVQKLLDEAIADLGGAGAGPGAADLVYGGNVDRWRRAANTLKARFHLHMAELEGTPRYQAALAAANQGINEAPANVTQAIHGQAPGDFRAVHGNVLNENANIWGQFLQARQDIVAGNALVALLKARNDPRLTEYFDATSAGVFGMDADGRVVGNPTASVVNTTTRRVLSFRQPFVTWTENQLILAEAKFRTNDAAGALTHVNNVRTALGMPALTSVTLQQIAEEKYIAMFQNIEVWQDWKRLCTPLLKPYSTRTEVIGRLPYGRAERTANPNIPLPAAQPTRNPNDPQPCPRP